MNFIGNKAAFGSNDYTARMRNINWHALLGIRMSHRLEQAGDTIVPEIQLYKRFKPFVEDVLPNLISKESPAYVAHLKLSLVKHLQQKV
jgi:hypothetical protein